MSWYLFKASISTAGPPGDTRHVGVAEARTLLDQRRYSRLNARCRTISWQLQENDRSQAALAAKCLEKIDGSDDFLQILFNF